MTKDKAVEMIMRDLGYPPGWRWYVNDVLDHKIPDVDDVDRETVKVLEDYIKIDTRG